MASLMMVQKGVQVLEMIQERREEVKVSIHSGSPVSMIGVLAGCLYLVDKAGMNAYCSGKKRESQLMGSGTNDKVVVRKRSKCKTRLSKYSIFPQHSEEFSASMGLSSTRLAPYAVFTTSIGPVS
jgi:hypothetical protein